MERTRLRHVAGQSSFTPRAPGTPIQKSTNSDHSASTLSGGIPVDTAKARSSSLTRAQFCKREPFFPSFFTGRLLSFSSTTGKAPLCPVDFPPDSTGLPVDNADARFSSRSRALRSRSHARRFSSVRFSGLSTGFAPDVPVDRDRTSSMSSAVCCWFRPLATSSAAISFAGRIRSIRQ